MTGEAVPRLGRDEAGLVMGFALLPILLFALTPITARILTGELDPLMAGLLRTAGAIVITLPVALATRLPLPRGARAWRLMLLSALLTFSVFPILFCIGIARTSASHAALIMASTPMITGLSASALERRLPRVPWWIGCAIAFAGEAALIMLRDRGGGPSVSLSGDLLVLGACFGTGTGYVAGARLTELVGAWVATIWTINFASLAQLPFILLLWPRTDWSRLDMAGSLSLLHLAIGSTLLALLGWLWALARGGIERIAVLQFVQPIMSLALAAIVLHEWLTPPLLSAAFVILAGVIIARSR